MDDHQAMTAVRARLGIQGSTPEDNDAALEALDVLRHRVHRVAMEETEVSEGDTPSDFKDRV